MADTSSSFTLMTNAGVALASQLLSGENKITSFRAVSSDTSYFNESSDTIAELTSVDPERQVGEIVSTQATSENTSQIQIDFKSDEIDTDYKLSTIAIYATDSNEVECLYAVYCLKNPDYMAHSTSGDVNTYFLNLIVGNAANVTIQLTEAGSVSQTQLEEVLKQYVLTSDLDALIAEKIPDTLADTTKDADVKAHWTINGQEIVTADTLSTVLPGNLVYVDQDVTITAQFTFDKVPVLSTGETLATSADIQAMVDQITELEATIKVLQDTKAELRSFDTQADYDALPDDQKHLPNTIYAIKES